MKVLFLALFFSCSIGWAQDSGMTAAQQVGLQTAQQTQQDLMVTGETTLQGMQQTWQFNQLVIQQMRATGVDTNNFVLNVPPWNAWKVVSPSHLDLSVKSGVVKRGAPVRIKWRGADYAAVYYTLDGSNPTLASARYTGPIIVNTTAHLRAIGIGWNYLTGNICKNWARSVPVDALYKIVPDSQSSR